MTAVCADHEIRGWASSHDAATGAGGMTSRWSPDHGHVSFVAWASAQDLSALPDCCRGLTKQLAATVRGEVQRLGGPVELEFGVHGARLTILRSRIAVLESRALVRAVSDLVERGLLSTFRALELLDPERLEDSLTPGVHEGSVTRLATGLGVSDGIASGPVVLSAAEARTVGVPAVLVADDLHPEHLADRDHLAALVATRGGTTSHGAVVARGINLPMVCAPDSTVIDASQGQVRMGQVELRRGDIVTVDGAVGAIYSGRASLTPGVSPPLVDQVLRWSSHDEAPAVLANADSPEEVRDALRQGAEGVGLCRIEHVLAANRQTDLVRALILTHEHGARASAGEALRAGLRDRMTTLFAELGDRPVTVRLLDIAQHELGGPVDGSMQETNPMMGVRGVRHLIVSPDLAAAQVQALLDAAERAGLGAGQLSILVPMVTQVGELKWARDLVAACCAERSAVAPSVGCMIETPRAALVAAELAEVADFLTIGGNDLTQFTLAMSRDDNNRQQERAYARIGMGGALTSAAHDLGVHRLVHLCIREARAVRRDIPIGFCGEQVGVPRALSPLLDHEPDYLSCGVPRIPLVRYVAGRRAAGICPDTSEVTA